VKWFLHLFTQKLFLFSHFTIGVAIFSLQPQEMAYAQKPTIVLGVLEDHPGLRAGDANFRTVRVVFKYQDGEWQAFPFQWKNKTELEALQSTYPQEMDWIIGFDGKDLGTIRTRRSSEFATLDSIGYQKIISKGSIPTIGKRLEAYSGFLAGPVYRPLVAISKLNYKDPNLWKRSLPSSKVINSARQLFKNRNPSANNCRNRYEDILKPWKYGDEDIKVIKSYNSKDDLVVISLQLTEWACDGPIEDGGPFSTQWYLIDPSGSSQFLGSDMWMVDAGDYDDDGTSELLFSVGGYDRGGYRLFFKNLSKSIEYLFSYH
jgi:hypothetical protein